MQELKKKGYLSGNTKEKVKDLLLKKNKNKNRNLSKERTEAKRKYRQD